MRLIRPGEPATALLVLAWAGLLACADPYRRPAMPRADREAHVATYGAWMPWSMRRAFQEGRITPGMPSYLLEEIYGEPDLVVPCYGLQQCEWIWMYGAANTHTVGSASLAGDTVVRVRGQLGEPYRPCEAWSMGN